MLRNASCKIAGRRRPTNQTSQGQNQYIPLKTVNVDATIRSFAADVTIKQVFRNEETQPIEAVYCFPIEEQAAVYSFTAKIDDREIIADLKEKIEAQQEYNDALQQDHGAYLLEQNEKAQDNFIINVGALPPGKECQISTSYVTELDLMQDGRKIRFVVPTTIAPRYDPNQGGIASPAGTTSKYVQSTPYTIQFRCQIEKMGIARVSSSSHPIQVDFSHADLYRIEFSQENTHLDRDILLDLDLIENRPNLFLAVEPGAVMASFTPTDEDCRRVINDSSLINEFIFVVDCSGSMQDENKIGLARQALLLFLKSLPINCHFNIIRFGRRYESLFSTVTTVYNEESVKKAEDYTKKMEANLGGTELLKPLEWLEKNRPNPANSRQVFVLTDGEISNVNEVLDLCRSMLTSTRIFSFGLGHSPSRSLVKGLARATHGRFVFIPPNESVDVYVGEQLQKALQSSITNIQVKWNMNTPVMSAPKNLPPVYANDRLIVYGLHTDSSVTFDPSSTVELYRDQNRLCEARIDRIPNVTRDGTIARLAAKALILELQHSKKPASNISGSLQDRFRELNRTPTVDNEKETQKKQIIELSLKYKILSPYTAFVGVEKRTDGSNAGMVLREVPVQVAADDKHLLSFSSSRMPSPSCAPGLKLMSMTSRHSLAKRKMNCAAIPTSSCNAKAESRRIPNSPQMNCNVVAEMCYTSASCDSCDDFESDIRLVKLTSHSRLSSSGDDDSDYLNGKKETWPTNERDIVRLLINKQKFDGLWELNGDMIEKLSGKPMNHFKHMDDTKIFFSALIVHILETRYASLSVMWYGIVQKARQRLLSSLGNDQKQLESLIENIRQQL